MTTSIDIANRALVLLGAREITSFTEGSNESKVAKSLYLSARDYVLRAYPWASLKKRTALVELADKPVNGFMHQYQLPEDNVRVIEVHSPNASRDEKIKSWEIEGTKVLCDHTPVSIVYLSDSVPETKYSTQLVQALVYRLASEMAYPVTGNNTAMSNFASLFENVLMEARTTDALEQSAKHMGPSNFVQVRF